MPGSLNLPRTTSSLNLATTRQNRVTRVFSASILALGLVGVMMHSLSSRKLSDISAASTFAILMPTATVQFPFYFAQQENWLHQFKLLVSVGVASFIACYTPEVASASVGAELGFLFGAMLIPLTHLPYLSSFCLGGLTLMALSFLQAYRVTLQAPHFAFLLGPGALIGTVDTGYALANSALGLSRGMRWVSASMTQAWLKLTQKTASWMSKWTDYSKVKKALADVKKDNGLLQVLLEQVRQERDRIRELLSSKEAALTDLKQQSHKLQKLSAKSKEMSPPKVKSAELEAMRKQLASLQSAYDVVMTKHKILLDAQEEWRAEEEKIQAQLLAAKIQIGCLEETIQTLQANLSALGQKRSSMILTSQSHVSSVAVRSQPQSSSLPSSLASSRIETSLAASSEISSSESADSDSYDWRSAYWGLHAELQRNSAAWQAAFQKKEAEAAALLRTLEGVCGSLPKSAPPLPSAVAFGAYRGGGRGRGVPHHVPHHVPHGFHQGASSSGPVFNQG